MCINNQTPSEDRHGGNEDHFNINAYLHAHTHIPQVIVIYKEFQK